MISLSAAARGLVSAAFVSFFVSAAARAGTIGIDDFDAGKPQNLLGGAYGAWGKDPNDASQWCRMSFDRTEKIGEKGASLKLEYSVASQQEAYNGLWMKLNGLDLRAMKYLVFSVKGDALRGFTKCITVELKTKDKTARVNVTGISDRWKKVIIPLEKFSDIRDRSRVSEMTIVFTDVLSSAKKGCIYIDNLYCTDTDIAGTGEAPPRRYLVTDFDDAVRVNERGGRFDVWSRAIGGMSDPRQTCEISFQPGGAQGGSGKALKIAYALGAAKSSCDGVWMQLGDFDASAYRYLVLYVRGDRKRGYTRRLKLELKGAGGTGVYVVEGIQSGWKRVAVPLRMFQGIKDFKNLREFVIIFDAETVTRPSGTVYIDTVQFLKTLQDERRGS